MSPLTNALITYWQRLPAESAAARRCCLQSTIERVRNQRESRAALLPYALGDTDEAVVADATLAFVGTDAQGAQREADALDEVADWVRRGLALNRAAVFAALLSLGNERVLARLSALRLALSAAEVESVCRLLGPVPTRALAEFLLDWLELLVDGQLQRERAALAVAIQGWERARAA